MAGSQGAIRLLGALLLNFGSASSSSAAVPLHSMRPLLTLPAACCCYCLLLPCLQGLRTLVIGTKIIPAELYQAWDKRYQEAASSFHGRDEKLDALGREIEEDLELIGVTAIEDKLQVSGGEEGQGHSDAVGREQQRAILDVVCWGLAPIATVRHAAWQLH